MKRFPLLPRKKNTDKSHYGRVLVLAGSRSMTGAALLTCRAALESGAGLVTLGVPEGNEVYFSRKLIPETMRLTLAATTEGSFSAAAVRQVQAFVIKRNISCVALGPGISLNPQTQRFARALVKILAVPVVLDADGINSFKAKPEQLKKHHAALVMTPHEREFERVFSLKLPGNTAERTRLAKKISEEYGIVLVLKSHRTIVAWRNRIYLNRTGNPGMAKGGAGDVLTGILAAFIAQGLTPFEAASWAVYMHGRAGDLAAHRKGELGLLASDIIKFLSFAFRAKSRMI